MEQDLAEGKIIRSHKQNTGEKWMFLTPMINSCKLHLTTEKSLVPARAQAMSDSQDHVKETFNHSDLENSLHGGIQKRAVQELFASDKCTYSQKVLLSGAAVSDAAYKARHKARRQTQCTGETFGQNALKNAKPAGDFPGCNYSAVPGFLSTQLPFTSSFQRIDLERQSLEECPQLDFVKELQFLNLQHNLITKIQHLSHLQQLVLLNLHDNHISDMTGIEVLRSLRILILGKNRIHEICCLDSLSKLNMLDLHDNQICRIENVSHLSELRVLNLAGNNISKVENLQGLDSLTELNLQQNCISVVDEDRRMAGVQARKEEEKKKESHKQTIHKKRRLAIRNAAQQWEGVRACLELPSTNGAKEEVSPENSPAHSPAQTNGLTQEPSPDEPRRVSPGSGPERPSGGTEIRLQTNSRPNSPRDPKLVEAGSGSVQSLSLSDSHLAELDGDTLRLFGLGALEALERGWGVQTAGAVTVITFRYISFDAIVPTLPRIRVKFPNLSHMIFLETNISRLPQLAALAQVRRLDQLTIHPDGNPVVSLTLWRSFVIYRLHHFNLQRINGLEVTMNDVIAAERVFGTLGHIAATETPRCRLLLLLEESRKRQLQFLLEGRGRRAGLSPEELRDNGKLLGEGLSRALFNYPSRDCSAESPEEGSVESSERATMVEQYLQELVQSASDTNLKGEALHKLWPSMFAEMVRDCVLEMRDRAAFRQASLAKLSETK
ncbi:unnamed protein product [Oreochromis niloticus]|nr:unnamed protein product [Mustela putorius furo]